MIIQGFVEAIRPFQVRGWAFTQSDPSQKLRICVRVDGEELGSGAADLYRADLQDAGLGDGRHGFVVNVKDALPLEHPEAIIVEAIMPDHSTQNVPQVEGLVVEGVDVRDRPPQRVSNARGFYNTATDTVEGWAFDAANPSDHVEVIVEVWGRERARTRANLFRPDLVQAGIGTGDHAFVMTVPPGTNLDEAGATAVYAVMPDGQRVALLVAEPPREAPDTPAPVHGPAFIGDYADATQFPVIILGAARSGTSAMAQALKASGRYEGFEEGHFIDLLMPLLQTTRQFYETRAEEWSANRSTQIGVVPASYVEEGLKHIFVEAARMSFASGKWVDKTPRVEMIAAAPVLREIWPNARFIFMRRRAVENLDSRLRKFPTLNFKESCEEWALAFNNWEAVSGKLSGAALEIDQVFMAAHPHRVAAALGSFLKLDSGALELVAQALAHDHPERTAAQFGAVADIDALGWPADYIEIFRTTCAYLTRRAGYDEGPSYYLDGDESNGLVFR